MGSQEKKKKIYMAQQIVQDAITDKLSRADARGKVLRMATQLVGKNKDTISEECVRDDQGKVIVEYVQ